MIHSPRVFRGGADAGIGQALWVIVFVCFSGGSGSAGSPFESNPAFCRWGAGGADGGVRRTVLEHWSALDPTRASLQPLAFNEDEAATLGLVIERGSQGHPAE